MLFVGHTGEDLTRTYAVATTRCECLLVPRVQFLKFGKSSLLEQLKANVSSVFPTNHQAYTQYCENLKWAKYKKSVVDEIAQRRSIPNRTKWEDIPLDIRLRARRQDALQ